MEKTLRGQGLGTELLKEVEVEMKMRGFSKIRVGSHTKRSDPHRFYQSAGYELLKVWKLFEKTLR